MRGCQKKVVFLKNTGSELFEEAYFILKSDVKTEKYENNVTRDMVCEANRIIEENFGSAKTRGLPRPVLYILSFLIGAILSFVLTFLITR